MFVVLLFALQFERPSLVLVQPPGLVEALILPF